MQRLGAEYCVTDPLGRAIANAVIGIYLVGTDTLANVYPATGVATPTTATGNPFTTDAYGRWQCALPDGRYDIVVSGGAFASYTIPNVCVFDNTITYPSPALGTVTSVALSAPAEFTTGGSPVTGSGTLTLGYASWAQSAVLIGPTSGAGTPTQRVLAMADLPNFGPAAGTYGGGTVVPVLTVDAKGRITGIVDVACGPAFSAITGKPASIVGYGIQDSKWNIYQSLNNVSISATTAELTIFDPLGLGSLSIPAGYLDAGSVIVIRAKGYSPTGVSGTGNVRFRVYTTGYTLYDSGVIDWNAIPSNKPFDIEFRLIIRTTGSPGTATADIFAMGVNASNNAIYATCPVVSSPINLDTTITNVLDFTLQFSSTGHSLLFTDTSVHIENPAA